LVKGACDEAVCVSELERYPITAGALQKFFERPQAACWFLKGTKALRDYILDAGYYTSTTPLMVAASCTLLAKLKLFGRIPMYLTDLNTIGQFGATRNFVYEAGSCIFIQHVA
jgi:hypothetical protein